MIDNDFKELTDKRLNNFLDSTTIEFYTAQKRLCFAKIKRIYRRTKLGYDFGGIKVCAHKNMVVEGNHRYIAYLLAGVEIERIEGTSSHSDIVESFNKIEIDFEEDWDIYHHETRRFIKDNFLKGHKRRE